MRRLTEQDVPAWVEDRLLAPSRDRPVVAVTSHAGTDRGWIDAEELQRELGDSAEVVFLETGDATWALSEALPPLLDVYGGALRTWWPGLTRDSDPYDHKLWLVRGAADAPRVRHAIVTAVRARSRPAGETGDSRFAAATPERVRVTGLGRDGVQVAGAERRGMLVHADLPIPALAELLQIGCELGARAVRQRPDGRFEFSAAGLLPDAWPRFAEEVRIGDVVTGRVQNLLEAKKLVFVDVMPGVVGVCPVRELDFGFVERLSDFVQPGDLLAFEILDLQADRRTLSLSRKRAFGSKPRDLPPLFAGGRAFEWKPDMPWFSRSQPPARKGGDEHPKAFAKRPAPGPTQAELTERIDELEQQVQAAAEERQSLVAQIRSLRQQLQEAKKETRSREDRQRAADATAAREEPLASERAFLQAVRSEYARRFDEDDRIDHPLQRMRVGREFLASVRQTPGVEFAKVIEVCAEVAAGVAHEKSGRDVHPLRAGLRGADARLRARDGAKAWRCALQVNSPSARRLHWWNVPGPNGATIEFACVGVHDSFDIPEG